MGAADKRGTKEQRVAMAIERNRLAAKEEARVWREAQDKRDALLDQRVLAVLTAEAVANEETPVTMEVVKGMSRNLKERLIHLAHSGVPSTFRTHNATIVRAKLTAMLAAGVLGSIM